MNYEFPVIKHIDEVLPHVQGREEFVVADRDTFIVINYIMQTSDTFRPITEPGDLIRRECRGMIFDKATGKVIGRRYHKFFNIMEREETLLEHINFDKPHVILEKLDGSMITPFITSDGVFRVGTKMGETEIAQQAKEFILARPSLHKFCIKTCTEGYTPIFEWCSLKNRIVVAYPEDKLVLTAIRHMVTGQYIPFF